MIKRSPSRNPRSKGIKVKDVLQICLLLGVCFWLIYQVKHSYDKEEIDKKDAKVSVRSQSDDMPKFGRKDLHPRDEVSTNNGKHEEKEEDIEEVTNMEEDKHEQEEEEEFKHEEEEKEEENKPEVNEREEKNKDEEEEREVESQQDEEEQEDEAKIDETEDEGRGGRDDEIDEHDQEKVEGDANHEASFIDEEKEREEDVEEKANENDENEEETQTEHETTSEDQDHDTDGQNTHEAREEHYKADDASSAVTHDVQVMSAELENTNENSVANVVQEEASSIKNKTEDINWVQSNSTVQLKLSETGETDPTLNVIADGNNDGETIKSNSGNNSTTNATGSSISDKQLVLNKQTTEVSTVAGNNSTAGQSDISTSSKKKETVIVSNSAQGQNAAAGGTEGTSHLESAKVEQVNDITISDVVQSGTNQMIPEKTENIDTSGRNSESDVSDQKIKPEVTAEAEVNSGTSSTTKDAAVASHDENSNTNNESGGIGENSGSSSTNATENSVIRDFEDSSESSIVQDKKEARIELGTLQNTEEVNIEEHAAE